MPQVTHEAGGMRTVGVHGQDVFAARLAHAAHDRSAVSRLRLGHIAGACLLDHSLRTVGRLRIHDKDFVCDTELFKRGLQVGQQMPQILRFILCRDDDRQVTVVAGGMVVGVHSTTPPPLPAAV